MGAIRKRNSYFSLYFFPPRLHDISRTPVFFFLKKSPLLLLLQRYCRLTRQRHTFIPACITFRGANPHAHLPKKNKKISPEISQTATRAKIARRSRFWSPLTH